ncbi:carbohydrate porin [Acidisphaera sp. S103]|uniref:carbohydrate porin n=1 Tax=Acidisphaera sp. S103 TaxID=1747223 RepID=UPI00131B87ED|nr:carbohydrate porin [Acidisphaera sp. S103]
MQTAHRATFAFLLIAAVVLTVPTHARAQSDSQPSPAPSDPMPLEESWAVHGQTTTTWLLQPAFRSPYQGPQSLSSAANGRETVDATLYFGLRPWHGAEIWINPEIDQGFGLSQTFGVAGYVSGEAYKLGQASPYYQMPRAFFRQTIDLGGATQKVDPDLNQLGGSQTANRLVFTVGKFSVVDIFDTNKYAHDPRNDFLNWSIIDLGTFDYAANSWGYTYGAAAEWYQDWWTARVGLFDLSVVPNSQYLNNRFISQAQFVAELEERHTLWNQPGKLKVLYWLIRGDLGSYDDALALAAANGQPPSTAAVRNYRSKAGIGLNLEQQITPDLGVFARAGWTQGSVEEVDFTDINESVSAGLSLAGSSWGRPDDTVGLAGAINLISHQGKQYLAAGGLGGIIGDGQLPQAGPEQIVEAYYSLALFGFAHATADYQFINDPAYNRQRGPVSVFGLRLHAQF